MAVVVHWYGAPRGFKALLIKGTKMMSMRMHIALCYFHSVRCFELAQLVIRFYRVLIFWGCLMQFKQMTRIYSSILTLYRM